MGKAKAAVVELEKAAAKNTSELDKAKAKSAELDKAWKTTSTTALALGAPSLPPARTRSTPQCRGNPRGPAWPRPSTAHRARWPYSSPTSRARQDPARHLYRIAAVAENAGQLGIRTTDIARFTKAMIGLGENTNLTSEEASTAIAQIANIMGTTGTGIDRLSSTLVALGNNGASTEKDIVNMSVQIAASGSSSASPRRR